MTAVGNRGDFTGSDMHRMTGARALEFTLIGLGVEIVIDSSVSRIVESEVGSGYLRYVGMGGRTIGRTSCGRLFPSNRPHYAACGCPA